MIKPPLTIGMKLKITTDHTTSEYTVDFSLIENISGVLGRTCVRQSYIVLGKRGGKYILAYSDYPNIQNYWVIKFSGNKSNSSGVQRIKEIEKIE